jgi:hypothetical protein
MTLKKSTIHEQFNTIKLLKKERKLGKIKTIIAANEFIVILMSF